MGKIVRRPDGADTVFLGSLPNFKYLGRRQVRLQTLINIHVDMSSERAPGIGACLFGHAKIDGLGCEYQTQKHKIAPCPGKPGMAAQQTEQQLDASWRNEAELRC